jgi:hypothetical protein
MLLVMPTPSEAMRCGNRIVSTEDSRADVVILCGDPTFKETTSVETSGNIGGTTQSVTRGRVTTGTFSGGYTETATATEMWIYNCGEGRLIQALTFTGGKLIKIESRGHGSGPQRCD